MLNDNCALNPKSSATLKMDEGIIELVIQAFTNILMLQ